MSADFKEKPTLCGDLVTLRSIPADDATTFHGLLGDQEVARFTGGATCSEEAPAWTADQLREVYGRWANANDRTVFGIVENATARLVGESVLNDFHRGSNWCNFRIWISGARDRGLVTEATRPTLDHAFGDLLLNRVELEVYDFNPRARHVYEKAGFVLEGTRRQALRFDGEWIDGHVMSILASEWAEQRARRGA